jgi:hypothetical protein
MNTSTLDLAVAAVFGMIFLANFLAFRSSRKTYNQSRQLDHEEQTIFRREAAAHFFRWASTFAFSTWLFGALTAVSLGIAIFVLMGF